MANRSAVQIFRKHILGKGRTEHSGRGFWMMGTALTLDEIRENAYAFYLRNTDKVETFVPDDGNGCMVIRMEEGYGDRSDFDFGGSGKPTWYYRTLVVRNGMYGGVCATVSM